jgi:putative chitinase
MIDVYPPFGQGNMLYRWAHFLGQCSHESNYFQKSTEDMSYSPHRLLIIFPRHFNPNNVDQYAWRPDKIANRAYANRMGNGDERSGDGFRYRGRGFLQLTGKQSYAQFSQWMRHHDLVQHIRLSPANCVRLPEAVAGRFCWLSAIFYFETRHLWSMCDQGIDPLTIAKISYAINGGFHGLQDRIAWTHWWYDSLKKACDQSASDVR